MKTFSVNDVFGYVGMAAIGVAGYAYYDGNTNFAMASIAVGAFAFYATITALKEKLQDNSRQNEFKTLWQETAVMHDELGKLHKRINTLKFVEQTTFDDCLRELHQDRDERLRDVSDEFDAVYRHMETEIDAVGREMNDINNRIEQNADAYEFAPCANRTKRSK